MSKKIVANDGIATIQFHSYSKFCGYSGTGEFPPIGNEYRQFTFRPTRGENGLIAFKENYGYQIYQYRWTDEKLFVTEEEISTTRRFSLSPDLGIVVACSKWSYVTNIPKDTAQNCKLVDISFILKYIDGKIDIKDLERNSRSIERLEKRPENIARMKEEIEEMRKRSEYWEKGYRELFTTYSALSNLLNTRFLKIIDQVFFSGHFKSVKEKAKEPSFFLSKLKL